MHIPSTRSRKIVRLPSRGRRELATLIPALGLVAGSDPFVFLDGAGWGGQVLAFTPERHLVVEDSSPFQELRRLLAAEERMEGSPHPLEGGPALFGYISYDAARFLERVPDLTNDDVQLPFAQFILPRHTITLRKNELLLSVPSDEGLEFIFEALDATKPLPEPTQLNDLRPDSNICKEGYLRAVEKVQEYVWAGDVFQVNISQRFKVPFAGSPLALYGSLKRKNPSPYGGILSFPGFVAISSSPEQLVGLQGTRASTRPIAGTYLKGANNKTGLLLDPKERAEHAMIVDLERNDLGRSAAYGTVLVEKLMTTETYSHVSHIVSEITAELAEGCDAIDLLAGMFPGGTITGCPKVRCMEIIEEIEPVRRSLYTGSFGYIGLDSTSMDMNIAIRTILLKDGVAYSQAGGGIVSDSVPLSEYRESIAKAAALLECLGAIPPL